MSFSSIFLLAGRFLFGKRGTGGNSTAKRSLRGAILGIACSLIPLVVVMELADGMIEGIMRRFIELGSYHAQAIPQERASVGQLLAAAKRAKALPGVFDAYAEMRGVGIAISGSKRTGAEIRAVEPRLFTENPAYKELISLRSGALSLSKKNSALLGAALAKKLGLQTGDRVNILTTRVSSSGNLIPRLTPFIVEGIISSGYQELDALWFFIPLAEGYRILPFENSLAFVGVNASKIVSPSIFNSDPKTYADIGSNLDAGWLDFRPWYRILESQYQSLLLTKRLLYLITALIVIVACVNVYQAVVMLVIERRQEIAILKGIGASAGGITLAFTLSGAFIGFVAMAIGLAAGIFFAVNVNASISIAESAMNHVRAADSFVRGLPFEPLRLLDPEYYLEKIPIRLNIAELLVAAYATIILSAFAAYIPARGAGKTSPLEVMRKV
jgi:lipoprotein-releasing system permease protein